ncbi:hypothetical protein [Ornithobacterium rhinotracheale]|uniref:hypothetical protein n=1 Tax=Ornithobacterium rhinotracheale TaxID=28251 RepID=UPI00403512EF
MKRLFILFVIILTTKANSQVAIGKETFRSKGSILEFFDAEEGGPSKGIILPTLSSEKNAREGAMWLDFNRKRVFYKTRKKEIALTDATNSVLTEEKNDDAGQGILITDSSIKTITGYKASLKLESKKAALLFPHVFDVTTDIPNPVAGIIAYDKKTKSLAIFNGEKWYFWN